MPRVAREALPRARWNRDDLDQHSECTRLGVRYAPPLVDEDLEAHTARRQANRKVLFTARKRQRTVAAARQAREEHLAKKRGMDAQQHAQQEAQEAKAAARKAEQEQAAARKAQAQEAKAAARKAEQEQAREAKAAAHKAEQEQADAEHADAMREVYGALAEDAQDRIAAMPPAERAKE